MHQPLEKKVDIRRLYTGGRLHTLQRGFQRVGTLTTSKCPNIGSAPQRQTFSQRRDKVTMKKVVNPPNSYKIFTAEIDLV